MATATKGQSGPYAHIKPVSLDDTVLRMQREILHDVVAGIVPRTARRFTELGNSRDLSVYGGFAEMGSQGPMPEGLVEHMQKAQDHVDVWLFNGGLEKEGLPPGWKPATNATQYQFDPSGSKSQTPLYELAVRAEGFPTLDLMVLQDGEKFIGVHGVVKMDAFDSPTDAAEQASKWGMENGWGEEILHQALWPETSKGLKGCQLLFSVGTGDGWNCHASDGMGIRIDPVGAGAAWDWSANRAWMASCGTGQAATREEAIDAAVGALIQAGIGVDSLPSEVSGKPDPGALSVMPVGASHEEIFLHHEIYIEPGSDKYRGGFEWSVCRNGVELDAGQEFSVDDAFKRAKGVVTAKFDELTATAAKQVGAAYTFCQVASEVLAAAQGDVSAVDWNAFNNEVIQRSILQNKQPFMRVAEVLLEFSPGAITDEQQGAILVAVRKAAQQLEAGAIAAEVSNPQASSDSGPSI